MGRYKRRIDRVFGPDSEAADADWYVDRILESWREATAQLRRTSVLLIVSLVAFALLSSGDVSKVGVASMTVEDLSPLIKLAPVVIAFLYLDLVLQFFSTYEYSELYADASKLVRPELHRQELDVPLAPTLGAMWGGQSILSTGSKESAPRSMTGAGILNALCGMAFLLIPLGFLLWAFVVVFGRFGTGDLIVWLSLVASMICIARAIGIAASWFEAMKNYRVAATEELELRLRRTSSDGSEHTAGADM